MECRIKGGYQLRGYAGDEEVNVSLLVGLRGIQEPDDRVLQLRAICARKVLHGIRRVVHHVRVVRTQGQYQLSKIDQILTL